jgi:hypothetical protein
MRLLTALLFAVLVVRPASAEDAEKTWTLKEKWKPVAGAKVSVTKDETATSKLKVSMGGQVVREEDSEKVKAYDYTMEITAVSGEEATGKTWTFRKARVTEDGEETVYGFEGKTVVGKRDDKEAWTLAYDDGTAVAEGDLAALEKVCDTAPDDEDKPDPDEAFAPKNPVKAGDSWSPDMEMVMKAFGGKKGPELDKAASKGTCTLKSVESRNGASYGVIGLSLDLAMLFPPPVKLEKSLPFTIKGEMNICIDGTQPDGTMKMDALLEGTRKGTVTERGQEIAVELEMLNKMNMVETKKTVK